MDVTMSGPVEAGGIEQQCDIVSGGKSNDGAQKPLL